MKRDEMLSLTAEDINSMKKEQLLDLAKAEQKAIKDARYRLKQKGLETQASRSLGDIGNISAKSSMDRNDLLHEVTKGRVILNYKTLYLSDAKKVEQDMITEFERETDRKPSKTELQALWKIIDKIREENPALVTTGGTNPLTEVKQAIYDVIHENRKGRGKIGKKQIENMKSIAENKLKELYQERQYDHEKELYGFDDDEDEEDFPF